MGILIPEIEDSNTPITEKHDKISDEMAMEIYLSYLNKLHEHFEGQYEFPTALNGEIDYGPLTSEVINNEYQNYISTRYL